MHIKAAAIPVVIPITIPVLLFLDVVPPTVGLNSTHIEKSYDNAS